MNFRLACKQVYGLLVTCVSPTLRTHTQNAISNLPYVKWLSLSVRLENLNGKTIAFQCEFHHCTNDAHAHRAILARRSTKQPSSGAPQRITARGSAPHLEHAEEHRPSSQRAKRRKNKCEESRWKRGKKGRLKR